MNDQWIAEVTNDPARDFELCIQISKSDERWGVVERNPSGALVLNVEPSQKPVQVPAIWLSEILIAADRDLR